MWVLWTLWLWTIECVDFDIKHLVVWLSRNHLTHIVCHSNTSTYILINTRYLLWSAVWHQPDTFSEQYSAVNHCCDGVILGVFKNRTDREWSALGHGRTWFFRCITLPELRFHSTQTTYIIHRCYRFTHTWHATRVSHINNGWFGVHVYMSQQLPEVNGILVLG